MKTEEILEGLKAPIKSFRVFALEQAIQTGNTRDLLDALEKAHAGETDEECLLLLTHAMEAVRGRLEKTSTTAKTIPAREFAEVYQNATDQERLRLLLTVSAKIKGDLGEWVVETLENCENPAITSQLIKSFGPYWPMNHLSLLLSQIDDPSPTVRYGVLETMIALCPFRLPEFLPVLLKDEDPRVRALAIRALAKVDPAEAQEHMEAMLLGGLPLPKLAILQAAIMIPFPIVKAPLLKFLTAENDLSLIEKAGYALQINPDPDVPYRLLEILEHSRPGKVEMLQTILNGACAIIKDSGIMGDEFDEFITVLKLTLKKRSALRSVQIVLSELKGEAPEATPEAPVPASLELSRETALLREALLEEELQLIAPGQKAELASLLSPPVAPPPPAVEVKSEADFTSLGESDRVRWLALVDSSKKDLADQIIAGIFQRGAPLPKLLAAALKAAIRLQLRRHLATAEKFLNHGNEPLAIAAMEYQAAFDPDKAQSLLGRFLKSPKHRIRGAAVRILRQFDPLQASSTLMTMLKNPEHRNRQAAIACLMSFDFPLIRDQLTDLLESSRDQDLLKASLVLYQNNPHPENLFQLYRLEKAFPQALSHDIFAVRNANVELIKTLRLMEPEQLKQEIGELEKRWKELTSKKKRPPAYSFRVLHPQGSFWSQLREGLEAAQGLLAVGLVMVFGLLGFGLLLSGDNSEGETKKIRITGALLAEPIPIQAVVEKTLPEVDEIQIITTDNTLFQLRNTPETADLQPGDKIQATIRPFRITPGKIFARFARVERL